MAITKNRQSKEKIYQMALRAFPEKQMKSYRELTEGMCNIAYFVEFTNGDKSVLKIASGENRGRMSNEVNLMKAEVEAMRLVHRSNVLKVAEVQYYDASKEFCDGEYFFMEALDGNSFSSVMGCLSEEEKSRIHYEIGMAEKKITSIHNKCFGLLGDMEHSYDNLFDFVYYLISNVLSDAEKKKIEIGISTDAILSKLVNEKELFLAVKSPSLVHWDMWEGNIFIKEKHISGVIDWERAMWGEAFMDDRFRSHNRNPAFLKGYGQEEFTDQEMRRIYWYDALLYLTMMTEGAYREYEDDGQYQWVKPLFEKTWDKLSFTCTFSAIMGE